MARKKNNTEQEPTLREQNGFEAESDLQNEAEITNVSEALQDAIKQIDSKLTEKKYRLRGLLLWGNIVYSTEQGIGTYLHDEEAEKLIEARPELKSLFY